MVGCAACSQCCLLLLFLSGGGETFEFRLLAMTLCSRLEPKFLLVRRQIHFILRAPTCVVRNSSFNLSFCARYFIWRQSSQFPLLHL
ncbi:hypothetical protein XENTR_v10019066 [Xenopus tropicalis]|nr:hypothetical protein XENTR_v10019066 [Xenopus tropicalis]